MEAAFILSVSLQQRRILAEGQKLMGFNVLRLGLPVPYLINCILQRTVGTRVTRDIAETGELYPPEHYLRRVMP
ncbi:MAG: hypothetical protein HXS54_15540 [Theionarchaea archaeon]|nr:hypothetical protein [Theionarchaea archaeon]